MAGAELRHAISDRRGMGLNLILGVAAESVSAVAEVMLLPSLVLAFFVAELTPSYWMIGLVPAIAISFWTLARLPAHLLVADRRRMQPWAFAAALVRAAAIAILAVVASRTEPAGLVQSGRPLLGTFFLCLIVYALAGGFGSVPGTALLRVSVPGESWRDLVRWRAPVTAVLSLLAALVVGRLLGTSALAFPGNYGRLFLVATVCLIAVAVFTAAMQESAVPASFRVAPTLTPRALRQPLHDPRYRRFLFFRVILSATAAIDPFLFLYAVIRLGAPTTAIGGYVLAGVLGWLISAPVWMRLNQRSGPRAVLQAATVVRLVVPAMALALPPLAATQLMRARFPDASPIVTVYGVAFFAIGAALAAQSRANHDYLAALAPRPLLSAYTGLTNAILAIAAFAPVLGGMLIERSGYEALFVVAAALGLVAVFSGGWLVFTPARPRDDLDALSSGAATRRALSTGSV